MGRTVYTKLIITAIVTSIAFGGFTALNLYIFRDMIPRGPAASRILYIRPDNGPHMPPIRVGRPGGRGGESPFFPKMGGSSRKLFILKNSLFITGAMLIVWGINICLLLFIERTYLKQPKRKLIRYAGSYLITGLLLLCYISGTSATENIHPIPTPGYRMHLQLTQLPFMTAVVLNTIVLAMLELILIQKLLPPGRKNTCCACLFFFALL